MKSSKPTCKQIDTLLLHEAIMNTIVTTDKDKVLSLSTKYWMCKHLERFVKFSVSKFIKGQLEHGGDIRTRDTISDMGEEIVDLLWYHSVASDKTKR